MGPLVVVGVSEASLTRHASVTLWNLVRVQRVAAVDVIEALDVRVLLGVIWLASTSGAVPRSSLLQHHTARFSTFIAADRTGLMMRITWAIDHTCHASRGEVRLRASTGARALGGNPMAGRRSVVHGYQLVCAIYGGQRSTKMRRSVSHATPLWASVTARTEGWRGCHNARNSLTTNGFMMERRD